MKVPMTVEGAERLKAELQRLKSVERPAIIQAIAEARSHGDLSENADYDAAKERQGFVEGRIAEIEHKLAGAQVIDPAEVDGDGRVVFGATVEIEDLDSGDVRRWQIVGEDEADIKHGKISITSPIARAASSASAWRPAMSCTAIRRSAITGDGPITRSASSTIAMARSTSPSRASTANACHHRGRGDDGSSAMASARISSASS